MANDKNNYLALCIFDVKSDKYFQVTVLPWMLSSCARDIRFSAMLELNKKLDSEILIRPVLRENSDSLCQSLVLNCNGYSKEYDLEVFRPLISRLARQLLTNNYVKDLDDLSYGLTVNENTDGNGNGNNKMVLTTGLDLTISETALLSTIKGYKGQFDVSLNHMSVFMDKKIERLMIDYVMQDTSRERAGFMTGQLCRDPESRHLYLLCSGHITMLEIENEMDIKENSSLTHFQFNPEYFIKATRMLAARNNNEMIVGWYHSHPWYFETNDDSAEKTSLFFSQDDLQVHESAFSAPYHVGVVIGKHSGNTAKPGTQMYGWRNGKVEPIIYNRVNLKKSME